tara:strand:+ start:20797 stop:22374 length:1578 start_codon:yes stop_codon:yes gene_type:complete
LESVLGSRLRIFIGFDPEETVSYHLLTQSLLEHSSKPLSIIPIVRSQIPQFKRQRSQFDSSDFSISRFLVPFLSDYEGWSLYCDCDFIFCDDPYEIFSLRDDQFSVMLCKHDYQPNLNLKKNSLTQYQYKAKNWSSLMLFNNERCRALSIDYVNEASGLDLHQFKWIKENDAIGSLPLTWNHLVGEFQGEERKIQAYHFTNGTPFEIQLDEKYQDIWIGQYKKLLKVNTSGLNEKVLRQNTAALPADFSHTKIRWRDTSFDIIDPLFRHPKKGPADYLQLLESKTGKIYTLKGLQCLFKGKRQKIPFIKTQYIGSLLAEELGIECQKSELITIQNDLYLLTHDIRSYEGVIRMEPLVYLTSRTIDSKERNPNILLNILNEETQKDCGNFMIRILLFDLLIQNPFRDARSLRLIFDEKEIDKCGKYEPIYDFVIDTNFGGESLVPGSPACFSVDSVYSFISLHRKEFEAVQFIDSISKARLIDLINKVVFFDSHEKEIFQEILENQFQKLSELKRTIISQLPERLP